LKIIEEYEGRHKMREKELEGELSEKTFDYEKNIKEV
jgi:hypothetical protein